MTTDTCSYFKHYATGSTVLPPWLFHPTCSEDVCMMLLGIPLSHQRQTNRRWKIKV